MKLFFGGSAAFMAATLLAASLLFFAKPLFAETSTQQQQQPPASPQQPQIEKNETAPVETEHVGDTPRDAVPALNGAETPATTTTTTTAPTVTNDKADTASGSTLPETVTKTAAVVVAAASPITEPEAYIATAYNLPGRTASGLRVAKGIIAADPRILPLGTRVRLEAGPYSGEYIVADTGSAVRGRKIDVWVPTYREACRFGRRNIRLSVLSYGKRHVAATHARRRSR